MKNLGFNIKNLVLLRESEFLNKNIQKIVLFSKKLGFLVKNLVFETKTRFSPKNP
jgi:hypothetical protein